MSAGIYNNTGGVSRKAKALYGRVGGVNRKIKEEYAKVNGVVRKIYSGYDCQATVNTVDAGTHSSYINSNGAGKLHIWSSYYDTDPATYTAYIDFTFKEPIDYAPPPNIEGSSDLDYKNAPSNACVKFIGSWPDSDFYENPFGSGIIDYASYKPLHGNDCYLQLIDNEKYSSYYGDSVISKQTPGYTPHTYEIPKYGITVKSSGSSKSFRIKLKSVLKAREGQDAEQYITWDKIIFLGKTLNSIEVV